MQKARDYRKSLFFERVIGVAHSLGSFATLAAAARDKRLCDTNVIVASPLVIRPENTTLRTQQSLLTLARSLSSLTTIGLPLRSLPARTAHARSKHNKQRRKLPRYHQLPLQLYIEANKLRKKAFSTLPEINIPTLFVHGERDFYTGPNQFT